MILNDNYQLRICVMFNCWSLIYSWKSSASGFVVFCGLPRLRTVCAKNFSSGGFYCVSAVFNGTPFCYAVSTTRPIVLFKARTTHYEKQKVSLRHFHRYCSKLFCGCTVFKIVKLSELISESCYNSQLNVLNYLKCPCAFCCCYELIFNPQTLTGKVVKLPPVQ
jgi:hypothetical protein